ncbi:hypothetical protein PMAYCL1PPCAC_15940, partial [Pristionchus mayeri]
CPSKRAQWMLVALVFVMAACLLFMSGLYLIEFRSRPREVPVIAKIDVEDDEPLGLMKQILSMPRVQPGTPPLHGRCLHAGCRSFCCAKPVSHSDETRFGGFSAGSFAATLAGGSRKAFLAAVAGMEQLSPTAFFPKPLSTGTRIEVIGDVTMTIDARYCAERSCDQKRGRYYLFVPVSPYMPTAPVLLRISAPPGSFVQSCGRLADFQEEECSMEGDFPNFSLTMPSAVEVAPSLFEVSAGSYKRSAYRFRVGTNTEACSQERLHHSFQEYNIFFYRTCED